METLRLEQSEYLYRRVARPIDVDGLRIPAGWILRLCVNESHRDPAVFADPDRFDPRRFRSGRTRAPSTRRSAGTRTAAWARTSRISSGRLLVEELALGYAWTVVSDGPIERGSRHRDHWRPSARRRIAMRPRAAFAGEPAPGPPDPCRTRSFTFPLDDRHAHDHRPVQDLPQRRAGARRRRRSRSRRACSGCWAPTAPASRR